MNNLKKNEKILLTVVVAVCLTFLYVQLYLPKQTEKIDGLKSSISDYESKLESLKLTSLRNIKLRDKLDGLEAKYKQTIAQFPKEGRVPEIAQNFDEYTKKNSIMLSNVGIGDAQEFSQEKDKNANVNNASTNAAFKLFVIPTTLSVSGEYLKVNSFLDTIEKDTRLAKIENLTLASNGPGKVSATLTANYYYVPGVVISTEYDFNDGRKNKEDMFKE